MFCCRTGMQFRMRFRRRMHKRYFQKGGAGMAQGHIDVVSDFIYDASNQQYNRAYKFWRKNTPSAGAYRYIDNERESVFVSGKPSARSTAAQTEKRALSFSAEVIGAALLVLLVCALGGSSLLIWILRQFGVISARWERSYSRRRNFFETPISMKSHGRISSLPRSLVL